MAHRWHTRARATRQQLDPVAAVACGLLSACGGGVMRDLLCLTPPRVLHSRNSIYATPALLGAAAFVGLRGVAPEWEGTALGLGFALAVALRVAAWNLHLWLPTWLTKPSADRTGLTRFFQHSTWAFEETHEKREKEARERERAPQRPS